MTWRGLAAFFAQGVFVKQVFGHAVLRSSHATQVGHPVCQFLDGLHLLVQIVCLDEITHMWVVVIRAELVHVQQGLVHALLELQGTFKGLYPTAPLIPLWFPDVLQEDPSPPLVLQFHELLSVLTLLLRLIAEEFGKVVQCLVVPVKVVCHRQVDVGGIQLQVDLPVDRSLAVLVEVLSHLGTHGSKRMSRS